MRKIKEFLNIIIIRDNGPRHSFRVRRGRFIFALLFFISSPLLAGALSVFSWRLWQENGQLHENTLRLEGELNVAQITAERLENLEELLREDNAQERAIIVRGAADTPPNVPAEAAENAASDRPAGQAAAERKDAGDVPAQGEFPAVNTEYLKVDNVRVRALRDGKIRISLDLHNTDSQKILSGTVRAVLVTSNGTRQDLSFTPEDVGDFKISRFKRTVMVAGQLDRLSLVNAQVIIEVLAAENTVAFRNIFAVER
ncbi:MAG: hypothetical protein LBB60_00855 [Desulfovibrio sp.]|jgi:hypothetical protein|nr:hypothetical protein [Desulfovibrio sp.]